MPFANRFRWKSAVLAAALLLAAPAAGRAATIDLAWTSCTGPVNMDPEFPQQHNLWVSTVGSVSAHRGYEVRIQVEGPQGQLPDAWRFDDTGCQTPGNLVVFPAIAAAKACPPFNDSAPTFAERRMDLVTTTAGYVGVVRFRVEYPARVPDDPTQRRHLGLVQFDHTFSVTGPTIPGAYCGGYGEAICLQLIPESCHYTVDDGPGTIVPFTVGNGIVTFRGGGTCGAVPASPSTWGQIKGQYRR